MDKVKANANNFFSAGLGKGGKAAAWAVAIGAVAAYSYYENRDNGQVFSKDEQAKWNANKKPESPSK